MGRETTVRTPGGRMLAVAERGAPDGIPVLSLHGTPGSRVRRFHDEGLYERLGVRLVTYDRPGYGGSSRHAGRTVADCAADVAAVADELGIERFAVTGRSGGGPHALAAAALLPGRVTRAACVVSIAPYDAPGLDWLDGMDRINVDEHDWALQGAEVLAVKLRALADSMLADLAADPASDFGISYEESDRAVLARPELHEIQRQAFAEAFRAGVWGWVDDDLAFTRPWGFDVTAVRCPARVVYGEADVLVPRAHGEWLAAHVPGAEVVVEPAGGHLGDLADPEVVAERLLWLIAPA